MTESPHHRKSYYELRSISLSSTGLWGDQVTKVIKVQDRNYRLLLEILHRLEQKKNERLSFNDAISLLIKEHQEKLSKS